MAALLPGLALPPPASPASTVPTMVVPTTSGVVPAVLSRRVNEVPLPMSCHCLAGAPVCSRVIEGEAFRTTWTAVCGTAVPTPTLLVWLMYNELDGALPSTVNGTVLAERSSIENMLAPPAPASFARSCQSVVGNPGAVLVSEKRRRTTDCLRTNASLPKASLLLQPSPMQPLPSTIRSSGTT